MRRAQSSTEYVLAMVGLVLTLVALYELSNTMNSRLLLISSQMEGERAAAQIGRAADSVMIAGNGSTVYTNVYTFPSQAFILSGAEIIGFGAENQTAAFMRSLGPGINAINFTGNQTLNITYNGSGITFRGGGT